MTHVQPAPQNAPAPTPASNTNLDTVRNQVDSETRRLD